MEKLNADKELFTLIERTDGKEKEELLTNVKSASSKIVAKGGIVERQAFTESEYLTIKSQAEQYVVGNYVYYSYFDYENGGKECTTTKQRAPKPITDNNILVKDGKFYGALLPFSHDVDGRVQKNYYVVAPADEESYVVTLSSYSYSEWGNTRGFEYSRVEKRKEE